MSLPPNSPDSAHSAEDIIESAEALSSLSSPSDSRSTEVRPAYPVTLLRDYDRADADSISQSLGVTHLTARILAARDFKDDAALKAFAKPSYGTLPHADDMVGITEGLNLLGEIADSDDLVVVATDFDVDGITGGAQFYRACRTAGVRCQWLIPDRFQEGYGLNERIVREAHEAGAKLLVTIDYGTSNHKEIELAKKLGMKVWVMDHHDLLKDPPPADVFTNPKQPGCGFADGMLCGSGITWFALARARSVIDKFKDVNPKTLLPYATLGTICDIVPLKGPNRTIAKNGLRELLTTQDPGASGACARSALSERFRR